MTQLWNTKGKQILTPPVASRCAIISFVSYPAPAKFYVLLSVAEGSTV